MGHPRTLLVTLTGRDRPGVTSAVFAAVARHGVAVLDVEQVVIRGRLVLGVLLSAGDDEHAVQHSVLDVAARLGMEVEIATGSGEAMPTRRGRSHVTVLASPLPAEAVAGIAGQIAAFALPRTR